MKKLILSISTLLMLSQAATAQHTQTLTGFTNDCEEGSGTGYAWAYYVPNCAYSGENGGAGANNIPVNELRVQWGQDPAGGRVYLMFILTTPIDLSLAANQKFVANLASVDQGPDVGGNPDQDPTNDTPMPLT